MATLLSRKYSIICYSYSGGTLVFNTPFALGVLTPNHVAAYVEGDVDGLGEQNYLDITYDRDTGYTTVNSPITIPEGETEVEVTFTRTVPKDVLYISFASGTDVTKTNIDGMVRYSLMALHEVLDGRWDLSFDWTQLNDGYKDSLAAYNALLETFEGGTTNQVLTKHSNADMDFGWSDVGKLPVTDLHENDTNTEWLLTHLDMEHIFELPKTTVSVTLCANGRVIDGGISGSIVVAWADNAEVVLQGCQAFTIDLDVVNNEDAAWYGIDTDSTSIQVSPYPSGVCLRYMGADRWLVMGDGRFM